VTFLRVLRHLHMLRLTTYLLTYLSQLSSVTIEAAYLPLLIKK